MGSGHQNSKRSKNNKVIERNAGSREQTPGEYNGKKIITIYLSNSWQCFQGDQIRKQIRQNKIKIKSLFHVKRKLQREGRK